MDLKNIVKEGAKFIAVKKGAQMTGGLLKWGAVAGLGYLGYKMYQKRNERETTDAQAA